MSQWGTLEAGFVGMTLGSDEGKIARIRDGMPKGSEHGPDVLGADGTFSVSGRLRDVSDMPDSFVVLAWFAKLCEWCDSASLVWQVGNGPAYEYRWADGRLSRLRGVLDA